MNKQLATVDQASAIEKVVIQGDLAQLSPDQRVQYYRRVCESVGLNPFTKPFDYIKLNGRLTLYAKKDATEQLRRLHGVSIDKPDIDYQGDLVVVTVTARDKDGRTDSDVGAVTIDNLRGDAKANAIMKAITKAKRRVTLSICGLGWLDETEIETIPDARPVNIDTDTGEIVDVVEVIEPEPEPEPAQIGLGKLEMALYRNDSDKFKLILDDALYYKNLKHLQGAWKKLGYEAWPGGTKHDDCLKRVQMYRDAKEYAKLRNGGMDGDAAVDAIRQPIAVDEEE